MRVLVTGCNGVLGRNLVEHLTGKYGIDVVGVDVTDCSITSEYFKFLKGDIRDEEFLRTVFADVGTVVHAASASPAFQAEEIKSIVVEGTEKLLRISSEFKITKFVYISSTAVYGFPDKTPMEETDKVQPYHDTYNVAKSMAEDICMKYRKEIECICILRPRTFIGPYRLGTFAMLFEWASEGRNFPMLGSGENLYQFLDVYDLCEAIFLALKCQNSSANDTFNIGATEFGTLRSVYQAVLDKAGYGKKVISLPVAPVVFILTLLSKLKISPLYDRLTLKISRHYYASTKKAEDILGFKPKFSDTESIIRNYEWYLENKKNITGKKGNGNNMVWNQGALKLAKIFF